MDRPDVLIEDWLPVTELGIEARRENSTGRFPAINRLHVWWARRPLAPSAGALLASLMPAWSPEIAERFVDHTELATASAYHDWFMRLCGILGDPISADRKTRAARESGIRIPNPFTYRQAHKNSPSYADLRLLHDVLKSVWGRVPEVSDPTAGGGSIPFEAIRYGLQSHANDLNSVAVAVLRAGVELPTRFGAELAVDLQKWGEILCNRLEERLQPFFPSGSEGEVATYLFARSVACPRTGKPVPLAPNWWITRKKGGIAIRLVVEQDGRQLDEPRFELVTGRAIDKRAADIGTITRGVGLSPWDGLTIDGDYIKAEAQAGRMGSILYAVADNKQVTSGRGRTQRVFRLPTQTDLDALVAAQAELEGLLPTWESEDVIPDEERYVGPADRSANYGILRWREMFSSRQLLVHGVFVEEYRRLIPDVREAMPDRERADAVLALIALIQGKAINYNSYLSSWHASHGVMRSVFERHDFAFKWTFGEFEGARQLYQWGLSQVTGAYGDIVNLLAPSKAGLVDLQELEVAVPASVLVTQGNAGDLGAIADASYELVCIDPPYYDNVMYAELADYFYVWEKRTLSRVWPDLFVDELTNKEEEAVANVARFAHAGRRKDELADLDYELKMTGIFEECSRILMDSGVMTVMFTHKKAEAWDSLGRSLLEAGFSIEASWPVPTESEHALNQARKNAAASTILLVCRKRAVDPNQEKVFFDQLEGEVRHAARRAYSRFSEFGISGVDLLLATYGPALSVLSENWPVYSSEPGEDGQARLLRPDEALLVAQEEVIRLQRNRLVSSNVEFDALTDFWLLAWDTFGAREFPFDEARKLTLAVGGVDTDDLKRAKIFKPKSGDVVMLGPAHRRRSDPDSELPGVHRDRIAFPALIDALHTSLYVVGLDGTAAAKAWLDQRGLTDDARFCALVEAAVQAVPRTKTKGELNVEEAGLLERLVLAAFPDIPIPEVSDELTQEELFDK